MEEDYSKAVRVLDKFISNVKKHYNIPDLTINFEGQPFVSFFMTNLMTYKKLVCEFDNESHVMNFYMPQKSFAEYNPAFKNKLDKDEVMLIFTPKDSEGDASYMTMFKKTDFLD